jgi:hypothetical protein
VEDADGSGATTNDRRLTVGTPTTPTGLCLFGDAQESCVTRWSNEVVNYRDPNSGYLLLQSRAFTTGGQLDTTQPITGQLGAVRIPGHASFASVVVGTPNSQPACGDGICTANPESNSCPVDCPGISGLTVSGITATTATVTWQTAPQTTTGASYGRSSIVFDQLAPTSPLLTLDHSIALSGLSPASTYYVRVVGVTASGASLSSVISFSTL